MSSETVLFDLLSATVDGRVFPKSFPEDTPFPLVVYLMVSGVPIQSQNSMKRAPHWQVDIWGQTVDEVVDTCAAVTLKLDHYNDGVVSILLENEIDMDDPATGLFRRTLEFFMWGN